MWVIELVQNFIRQNAAFVCACGVGYFAFVAGAFFVSATGKAGVYCGISIALLGGWVIFSTAYGLAWKLAWYGGAGLCVLGSLIFLGSLASHASQVRAHKRFMAAEEERKRRVQYLLPSGENAFVRARLNSLLETNAGGSPCVDMGYARKLLLAVQEKPLSIGERLQVEDLEKVFAAYLKKPTWTAAELREVNDTFSVLMKLCAKHSVVV